ncbi:hypothetical protein, partial [Anaerotruncus sp. 1XD42-93]|uniref:hypothetical protein n=1 Tax=Anaerotruncus sp. 1XD42-93 TaxID=2320853 RepID=UPI001A9ADDF3
TPVLFLPYLYFTTFFSPCEYRFLLKAKLLLVSKREIQEIAGLYRARPEQRGGWSWPLYALWQMN